MNVIYGKLTVISTKIEKCKIMAFCKCECGTTKWFYLQHLKSGKSKSCGCLRRELKGFWSTQHGLSDSPEYKTWARMNYRCKPYYFKHKDYYDRGITVCDRWYMSPNNKDAFLNFYSDMGKRPSPKHSIERINNNKGYSPDNCKWALPLEQRHNTRNAEHYQIEYMI